MDTTEFFENKMPNFVKLLEEVAQRAGISNMYILNLLLQQPTQTIINYFEKLSKEGVDSDQMFVTISKYADLSKVGDDDKDKVKKYLAMFLEVTRPSM